MTAHNPKTPTKTENDPFADPVPPVPSMTVKSPSLSDSRYNGDKVAAAVATAQKSNSNKNNTNLDLSSSPPHRSPNSAPKPTA